ncbi:MAG: DMT family transporter [Pseudomonadota bacterium]
MPNVLANPHLALLLTTLIWGGNAVAGRFAVDHISPMMLTAARWGIALALVAPFAWPHLKRDWPVVKERWVYLAACGAVGYTAFNFFLYSGLQTLSAIDVTLEQSAMPIVIFVLNYLIYRTGVRWLQLLGYAITVVGVLVVVSRGAPLSLFAGEASLGIGDFFMLCAAICYGGYSVALRSKPPMHWLSFLACLVAAAFVASLLGLAAEGASGGLLLPTTMQGTLVALYAGVFPSLVAQGLFIFGVERLGANLAGLYINMVPVFGALLAVAMLGEQLFAFHALAFVLVVGGILLAQRSEKTL